MIEVIHRNTVTITKYFAECGYRKSTLECESSDLMMTYGIVGYLICQVCKYTTPESCIHYKY